MAKLKNGPRKEQPTKHLGNSELFYNQLLGGVRSDVKPLNDDKLNASFQNSREVERDSSVTELLKEYVKAYKYRRDDNRTFRKRMFLLCQIAVYALLVTIVFSIGYSLIFTDRDVNDIVALVTACISSIGSLAFLLEIIAKYVFPSNEEEHTAQMVKSVQSNDLEERKLRYAHHNLINGIIKEKLPENQETDP